MVLDFHPPLLNASCKWSTTEEELSALYNSPHTGAVTVRTALLKGFPHDDAIHQSGLFDVNAYTGSTPSSHPSTASSPAASLPAASINTMGYSPHPLHLYIDLLASIEASALAAGLPAKPVIFSVTGPPADIATAYDVLAHARRPADAPTYMEINLSCPNIAGRPPPAYSKSELLAYLAALRAAGPHPHVLVGLKTPPYTYAQQFEDLVSALEESASAEGPEGGGEGGGESKECPVAFITATNTLGSSLVLRPDNTVPGRWEPGLQSESGSGLGGLAGAPLHPLALGNVATLREMLDRSEKLRGIEIIGVGGVSCTEGYARMRSVGAKVVGVATALGRDGVGVFGRIVKGMRNDKWDKAVGMGEMAKGKPSVTFSRL